MINHDKLIESFELGQKLDKYHVNFRLLGEDNLDVCLYNKSAGIKVGVYDNLDDLIKKLKKLTAPEPKYSVGDLVWHLNNKGKPVSFEVICIDLSLPRIGYNNGFIWYSEDQLYGSRQELIDAQIEYWKKLGGGSCGE
jgi:hypothetical protein